MSDSIFSDKDSKIKQPAQKEHVKEDLHEQEIRDTISSVLAMFDDVLSVNNVNKGVTEKCVKIHRTLEDTLARLRLESWVKKVVKWYLIVIAAIFVANYIEIKGCPLLHIPDGVMMTLLGTTTVNIIGLLAIVLRGHFAERNKDKEEDSKQ